MEVRSAFTRRHMGAPAPRREGAGAYAPPRTALRSTRDIASTE